MRVSILIFFYAMIFSSVSFAQCDVNVNSEKNIISHEFEELYYNKALEYGVLILKACISYEDSTWYMNTVVASNIPGYRNFKIYNISFFDESNKPFLILFADIGTIEYTDAGTIQQSKYIINLENLAKLKNTGISKLMAMDREFKAPPEFLGIEIYHYLFEEQIRCIEKYL